MNKENMVTSTARCKNHALALCLLVSQQSGPDRHASGTKAAAESSQTDGVRRAWSARKKRDAYIPHTHSCPDTVDATPVGGICCFRPTSPTMMNAWRLDTGEEGNASKSNGRHFYRLNNDFVSVPGKLLLLSIMCYVALRLAYMTFALLMFPLN